MFSPEPFAGEAPVMTECFRLDIADGEPCFPKEIAQTVCAWQKDCQWEWIIFRNDDNHMQKAECEGISIQNAIAVAGISYDYENSNTCVTLCGYTKDGRTIWGKSLGGNP